MILIVPTANPAFSIRVASSGRFGLWSSERAIAIAIAASSVAVVVVPSSTSAATGDSSTSAGASDGCSLSLPLSFVLLLFLSPSLLGAASTVEASSPCAAALLLSIPLLLLLLSSSPSFRRWWFSLALTLALLARMQRLSPTFATIISCSVTSANTAVDPPSVINASLRLRSSCKQTPCQTAFQYSVDGTIVRSRWVSMHCRRTPATPDATNLLTRPLSPCPSQTAKSAICCVCCRQVSTDMASSMYPRRPGMSAVP
mmetsp:Transcript_28769/g.61942  ORF Transcript_28769/g.61942 Transcript_28769/m.61942 type:complete len:257 (-) Transcript_28769:1307-2077(-)